MQSALDYLQKTASATEKLFEGVASYLQILEGHREATFVSAASTKEQLHAEFAAWSEAHKKEIEASHAAFRQYFSETFAQDALCGAVLHIAFKAIEVYSKNTHLPEGWEIVRGTKAERFAFGRIVKGVPLGLVIYAGRNQHIHYEDDRYREPTPTVFETMARHFGRTKSLDVLDPAFDLTNPILESYASNVTAAVGWRSYGDYYNDMRELLSPYASPALISHLSASRA